MKKVFIFGISGRMGQEIKAIVDQNPNLESMGGYSRSEPDLEKWERPDVVIDFSLPEAFPQVVSFIQKHQCPLVSGTTGLTEAQKNQLKELGSKSPVFWAANMSFGVYLMTVLTKTLAKYDKLYKFRIEETHHVHKKDKPSGTALMVADAAKESTNTLGSIDSFREGEVFGIHRFIAESANEKLEIYHEAFNRGLFAQGAVGVAEWLMTQNPGYFGMADFFQSFEPS